MSLTASLRKGMVLRHGGQLFVVQDFNIAQSGKQKPTVHVKLRSLASGNTAHRTLDELGRVEEAPSEVRQMQYLYPAGDQYVFMDNESFEQYDLGTPVVGDACDFLVDGETYRLLVVEDRPVSVQLADHVVLEVADTAPVQHGGGHSSATKEATLSSGLVIQVPLFIKTGDKISVDTASRTYVGKEH